MRFMLCHNNTTQVGGKELLPVWRNNIDSWIWVDLYNEPDDTERTFLASEFGLDESSINKAQRNRHPPSIEIFKDYIYLLLKPLDAKSDSLDFNTYQLAMFTAEHFLVTRRSKESSYLEKRWQTLEQEGSVGQSPMTLLTAMCHRVTERYGKILLDLEQRLDVIEDELFDSPTDGLMKELVGYNTGLRKMHRILNYYVDIFSTLRQHLHKTDNPQHDAFDDIYSLIERFSSLCALYQNVITDLIDAYISINGHRLNQIMKVLTIVTVVFVPLTLLVGIYGMNFEHMPELKSQYGYYILLSIMSSMVIGLLYLFRRVRWI
jgi:magnesium transporter